MEIARADGAPLVHREKLKYITRSYYRKESAAVRSTP